MSEGAIQVSGSVPLCCNCGAFSGKGLLCAAWLDRVTGRPADAYMMRDSDEFCGPMGTGFLALDDVPLPVAQAVEAAKQ